jgi:hypothetical protein
VLHHLQPLRRAYGLSEGCLLSPTFWLTQSTADPIARRQFLVPKPIHLVLHVAIQRTNDLESSIGSGQAGHPLGTDDRMSS